MRTPLVWLAMAFVLWPCVATAQGFIYVVYQAIPGTDAGWPDISRLDYGQRQKLTERVEAEIVPAAMRTLGLQDLAAETQIVPGGYRLNTAPSLVTRFPSGAEAAARRYAAAMGYVLRQDAILVFAADVNGDSLTVRVAFAGACLPPDVAQRFFVRASQVSVGLGGGFTGFACEMLFINLRDDRGRPFSGLEDVAFAAALTRAATGFVPAATVAGAFGVRAALIGEGWPGSRAGAAYVERLASLPIETLSTLDLASFRFSDMLRRVVETAGSDRPYPARTR